MIRLSEAMARLYCQEEVKPKHVKEAFRLLNKSIIRVETPDINFDEEDDQQQPLENGLETLLIRVQWNLCIEDMLGPLKMTFIQRCPLFRDRD